MSRPHTAGPDATRRSDARALPVCPACGTSARRDEARFCATCGRSLDERAYLPADTLRASYHQQHQHPALVSPHALHPACILQQRLPATLRPPAPSNIATRLALAFLDYALVPYLGILFCPGAIIFGGIGLRRTRHTPSHYDNARAAGRCVALGPVIFGAQVFLWWMLYNVSPWARR